jgi:hypothetical protein
VFSFRKIYIFIIAKGEVWKPQSYGVLIAGINPFTGVNVPVRTAVRNAVRVRHVRRSLRMSNLDFCSFCNSPAPKHEGGAEFNGVTVSGKFCSKACFDSWLKWKGALLNMTSPSVKFSQPGQKEGQAVLPL